MAKCCQMVMLNHLCQTVNVIDFGFFKLFSATLQDDFILFILWVLNFSIFSAFFFCLLYTYKQWLPTLHIL